MVTLEYILKNRAVILNSKPAPNWDDEPIRKKPRPDYEFIKEGEFKV